MALETRLSAILRFGVFEVDLRAGELRKQGKRIKVQEQPFRVLTVLLQRPGEVVTREELRNQNWPPDTFVDFDNSLNTAVNKLREALGDSADNPRFVETLPRRGYRFIAPVNGIQGGTPTKDLRKGVQQFLRLGMLAWTVGIILFAVLAATLLSLNVFRVRDQQADWKNFAEVRNSWRNSDVVGRFVVFDISHNRCRLIATIKYRWRMVYIRRILSHAEYDEKEWQK